MGRAYLPEDWIRDQSASAQVRCLAALLSSYAEGESGDQDVWPSPTTLATAMGMSTRNLTRLGDEGQAKGWWTRIYERNFRGGTELTWRLHFPVFSPTSHGTATETTPVSVGQNHSLFPADTETTGNGHGADTERTPVSAGRYEGKKVGRDEGILTLTPNKPAKKPSKPKAAPKPFTPPTHDEVAQRLRDKGLDKPTASFEATAFIEYWDASDWKGVTNWRKNLATWLTNWRRRNPVQQPRDFTSRWTVQPGQDPDPWGGCRE